MQLLIESWYAIMTPLIVVKSWIDYILRNQWFILQLRLKNDLRRGWEQKSPYLIFRLGAENQTHPTLCVFNMTLCYSCVFIRVGYTGRCWLLKLPEDSSPLLLWNCHVAVSSNSELLYHEPYPILIISGLSKPTLNQLPILNKFWPHLLPARHGHSFARWYCYSR